MPAFDKFRGLAAPRPFCASDLKPITPSDTVDLAVMADGLLLTAAGNVRVITAAGTTITIPGLAAGVVHPFRVSRVLATGTTATGIIGVYL